MKKISSRILILFLFSLVLFLTYMAEPTWGLLAKSQTDAQTIADAITAAISAHNADVTAHTAPGQAIYVHSNNPVIDHPPGSIPGDKFTYSDIVMQTNFEGTAGLGPVGTLIPFFSGVQMTGSSGSGWNAELYSDALFPLQKINFAKNPFIQFTFQALSTSNYNWYGHYGQGIGDPDDLCIGFEYTSGVLKGVVRVGSTLYSSTLPTLDTNAHIYRAFVDPVSHDAIFFMDGVQVGSISAASYYTAAVAQASPDAVLDIFAHATNSTAKSFRIGQLIIGNTPV